MTLNAKLIIYTFLKIYSFLLSLFILLFILTRNVYWGATPLLTAQKLPSVAIGLGFCDPNAIPEGKKHNHWIRNKRAGLVCLRACRASLYPFQPCKCLESYPPTGFLGYAAATPYGPYWWELLKGKVRRAWTSLH